MKRTESGRPYLSWCMIVRNAEKTLENTLKSIRERTPQAEIVIVDTMSNDSSPEIAKKYADVWVEWAGPRGDWSRDMLWFDDAAAARQKSFELASGVWRGWIDADDILPGPEEAERLLKLNARWKPPTHAKVVGDEGRAEGLEDVLLRLARMAPHADCVWAPYLYRRDENDIAVIWQERERIVKWDPQKWKWAEAAHEILVPINGHNPPKCTFEHLLFVHEKDFSVDETTYAIHRHFDVMSKQYERGDVTTRRCLYLAEYAKYLCPERELEFIQAAHEHAKTALDRMRCKLQEGRNFADRGLMVDATECFAAAVGLCPSLPDAWFVGAEAFVSAGDHIKAIDWLRNGLKTEPGQTMSYANPRHHHVKYPVLLAEQLRAIAKTQINYGMYDQATVSLTEAELILRQVCNFPGIGADFQEASGFWSQCQNDLKAHKNALALAEHVRFLLDNDESQKAYNIMQNVGWNLKDHPAVIEAEKLVHKIGKHVSDPGAYNDFYNNIAETGFIHSADQHLSADTAIGRAKWAAQWINENCPNGTVLDVGCCDGNIAIPVLEMCPGVKYIGVDVFQKSLDKLMERAKERDFADRVTLHRMPSISGLVDVQADVAIWFEVIEHVPDPKAELHRIVTKLKPGGHVLITTPDGNFDNGCPPTATAHGTPRDNRGHLRALTADDMPKICDFLRLETTFSVGDGRLQPKEMRSVVRRERASTEPTINFVVPSALWDWNASTVVQKGMGASEKAIVQIASSLAQDRSVNVYGPVPESEVFREVGYWPHAHLRHVAGGPVVISRHPNFDQHLDEKLTRSSLSPKYLWLQDAWYPELNAEVAKRYEKIVVVSNWHKQAMNDRHGVPLDKMVVAYNPIERCLYEGPAPQRDPHKFIFSSSPDRGLIRTLKLWPKIREMYPDATLEIYYGWRGCAKLGAANSAWTERFETMRKEYDKLRFQPGVIDCGMQSPLTLANAMRRSSVWLYATTFEETHCCTAVEMRASGVVPVCPPLAALDESARGSTTQWLKDVDDDGQILDAVRAAVEISDDARRAEASRAIEAGSVEAIVPVWRNLLRP